MKIKETLLVLLVLTLLVGGVYLLRSNRQEESRQIWGDDGLSTAQNNSLPEEVTIEDKDWQAGLERITAIENDLYENPNPDRVKEFALVTCRCYTETRDRLAEMQRNGWHNTGPNLKLTGSQLRQQLADDKVSLSVSIAGGGYNTVDRNGNQIAIGPTGPAEPLSYILVKEDDGRWYLADRSTRF